MTTPVNSQDRPFARVVADSLSPEGDRLTTMEVTFHRFVLAEFNTHRAFSRNSASSRAIPAKKMLTKVSEHPAMPLSWPSEKPGMQGGEELDFHTTELAQLQWLDVHAYVCDAAEKLIHMGLHKSVTNRLLEPFMWQTVVVSATDYENFFEQRCSPLAQPEIRAVADLMQEVYKESVPVGLNYGEFHTPYVDKSESHGDLDLSIAMSVARCARVSTLNHDGVRSLADDLTLYGKLITANPPHWSPTEHVATPLVPGSSQVGNFKGWMQWRELCALLD